MDFEEWRKIDRQLKVAIWFGWIAVGLLSLSLVLKLLVLVCS